MKMPKLSPTNSYIAGFVLSIILTIIPYMIVVKHILYDNKLIFAIIAYAILQLFVQLVFFLHLGQESKPRWRLISFIFMVFIILMIVIGSLWIMDNLNYHSMSPSETDKFLIKDEGYNR